MTEDNKSTEKQCDIHVREQLSRIIRNVKLINEGKTHVKKFSIDYAAEDLKLTPLEFIDKFLANYSG